MTRLALLCAFLCACDGLIRTPLAPPRSDAPPSELTAPCEEGGAATLVPARVRRLTPAEYDATVATLGVSASMGRLFPKDPAPNGYTNRSDALRVSPALVQTLWDAAPAMTRPAAQALSTSSSCGTTEACARTLLQRAARKAYRRPLSTEELDELISVFRAGDDFVEGLQLALEVVVQSADLLFHRELGDGTGRLTSFEEAEALSYLVTGAPPDDALAALASAGPLDADAREREARRLLEQAAAREVMGDFGAQWLEVSALGSLERDATVYPQWPARRDAALAETRSFVSRAVLDDGAGLSGLFTAGVLTQASVLAAHAQAVDSSPVRRGLMVRRRMLCQLKTLAPPVNLNISLPPPDPSATTRQRFSGHSSDPACSGCHKHMDPLGFGFEHYDAVGAYRAKDNGQSVDATGVLDGTDVDGPFDGALELQARLARSAIARDCFTQAWFEFALAHSVDDLPAGALCRLRNSARPFVRDGQPIRELVVELVRSDLFVQRSTP